MLGNGYPLNCFKGQSKAIAKELLCSICQDVARNIMSCNSCDGAFCEACIQRYWLKREESKCPCCNVPWGVAVINNEKNVLSDLNKFIHRDRKCESILHSQIICCPSIQYQALTTKHDTENVEDVEDAAQMKRRKIVKLNNISSGRVLDANTHSDSAVERSQSCAWTGNIRDFDAHVAIFHPEIASCTILITMLLRKLNETPKCDYLTKYYYIKEMLRQFANKEDLQLLSQSSVVSAFVNVILEPYNELDRHRCLLQGRDMYFNRNTPERRSILDEFRKDFSDIDGDNPDPFAIVLHEYQIKHCVAFLILPYLLDTGIISPREIAHYDQRSTAWMWMAHLQQIQKKSYNEILHDCNLAIKQLSNNVFLQSRNFILSLCDTINVFRSILLLLMQIKDEADSRNDADDEDDDTPVQYIIAVLFSRCILRLTYALRLVGNWPETIDRSVLSRFLLQTLVVALTSSQEIPNSARSFKLIELGVVSLMTSNHLGFFHEAVLHGGIVRFIYRQVYYLLQRAECTEAVIIDMEVESLRQANLSSARKKTSASRSQHSRKQTARNGKEGNGKQAYRANQRGSRSILVDGEFNEEQDADNGSENEGIDSNPTLSDEKRKNIQDHCTLSIFGDENTYAVQCAYWILARLFNTAMMRGSREHVETSKLIKSEIQGKFSPLFEESDIENVLEVSIRLWERTKFLANFSQLNNFIIRSWFGLVTAAGNLHPVQSCSALFCNNKVANLFKSNSDIEYLQLNAFEESLLWNMMLKGRVLLGYLLDKDEIEDVPVFILNHFRRFHEVCEIYQQWETRCITSSISGFQCTTIRFEGLKILPSLKNILEMGGSDLLLDEDDELMTVPVDGADIDGDIYGGDEVAQTVQILNQANFAISSSPSPSTEETVDGSQHLIEKTKHYRYLCEMSIFGKVYEGIDFMILHGWFPRHQHFLVANDSSTLYLCAPNLVTSSYTQNESERLEFTSEWIFAATNISAHENRNRSHALFADSAILAFHRMLFDVEHERLLKLQQARVQVDADWAPTHRLYVPTAFPSPSDVCEQRRQLKESKAAAKSKLGGKRGRASIKPRAVVTSDSNSDNEEVNETIASIIDMASLVHMVENRVKTEERETNIEILSSLSENAWQLGVERLVTVSTVHRETISTSDLIEFVSILMRDMFALDIAVSVNTKTVDLSNYLYFPPDKDRSTASAIILTLLIDIYSAMACFVASNQESSSSSAEDATKLASLQRILQEQIEKATIAGSSRELQELWQMRLCLVSTYQPRTKSKKTKLNSKSVSNSGARTRTRSATTGRTNK